MAATVSNALWAGTGPDVLLVVAILVALVVLGIAGAGIGGPYRGTASTVRRKREVLRGRPRPGQQASDGDAVDDTDAWDRARARRRDG